MSNAIRHYNETLLRSVSNSIVHEDTTPEEILIEIRNLNHYKNCGADIVPVLILKVNGVTV